jgi:dienelactone hydrolase
MACCPSNAHGYLASSRDHKGTKITVSGGTEVYSTGALGSSGRAILICPDIWGWDSGRLRNIADHLADAGYLVVVPKILQPACVTTPFPAITSSLHFPGTMVVQTATRFLLMSLLGFQRLVAGLS